MYEMTLKEMQQATKHKRMALADVLWRSGMLNQWLKEYPKTPQDAYPDLFPPKPTIKKPQCLYGNNFVKRGDEYIYEGDIRS